MINTSMSEVYGTRASVPIKETHPLMGQSPYGAAKIAADKLCEAYYCSFGLPVVTLRPFNTYGPRQFTRAVLPTLMDQLLSGRREVKLGRLDPGRDLTFGADTVEGFLRAGEVDGIDGEVIQLGTGRTVSIRALFDTACRVIGVSATVVEDQIRFRPEASEVMVLQSDLAKAKRRLNWEATISLEGGLARTACWLEKNTHVYDPEPYHV